MALFKLNLKNINFFLKLSGLNDTELGQQISNILAILELGALAGELPIALIERIRKSARQILTKREALEKALDDIIANNRKLEEGKRLKAQKLQVMKELTELADLDIGKKYFDDYLAIRKKFLKLRPSRALELWNKFPLRKHLNLDDLRKLSTKRLEEYPGLSSGNQGTFKVKYLEDGRITKEFDEFSTSGNREKILKNFGDPPKLPENTVDILTDYDEFVKFSTGAFDLMGRPRKFDSEIKFIYNFIKKLDLNHFLAQRVTGGQSHI